VESPHSLPVQPHVFGVGLGKQHVQASFSKHPYWRDILDQVAAGKALIGCIEEGNQLLPFDDVGDLEPVVLARINASGVVRTRMQQDDVPLLGVGQELEQIVDFNLLGGWIVVGIVAEVQTRSFDDVLVVGPGRVGQEHLRRRLLPQKLKSNPQSASPRKTLRSHHSAFLQQAGVLAEDQPLTASVKGRNSIDRDILLRDECVTLLRVLSATICSSIFLTIENTTGLRLSSLYAPTPRLTFLLSVSLA
jgi:hypothetical protein